MNENKNITELTVRNHLLELEVQALRSVLSEWEQDKSCYTQWIKAENIRIVLEDIYYE